MSGSDKDEGNEIVNWIVPAIWAFGLLFIVASFIQYVAGHKPSVDQQQYQDQCHNAKDRYWLVLDNPIKALSTNEGTEVEKWEERNREQVKYWCDLFAQQTAADAARYTAAQSLWITSLTIAGVLMLWWTLRLTRKAVVEAENATDAILREQRPWIKIDSFGIDKDEYLPFVRLKNVGKCPALNIDIKALIIVRPIYDDDFTERMAQIEHVGSQEADHAVLPQDFGEFILPFSVHRIYEQDDGGDEHMYCISISYTGSGCKSGRSFSIWHAINIPTVEASAYEEDERARHYT